ncbi:hypothetical protein ACFE04_013042 [Oxalis oulophora]
MLAGCSSSSLLSSPRHRLRSEAPCHFQLPSMNAQRLDLPPCSFSRKEASRSSSQPISLSVENKQVESKSSNCSLKQNIRLPPLATSTAQTGDFWEKEGMKSLKRFPEHGLVDEFRVKRVKKDIGVDERLDDFSEDCDHEGLSLSQLGAGNFWFQSNFTDFGEKSVETSHRLEKDVSGSSDSSENRSLGLRLLHETTSEHEVHNGSGNPYQQEHTSLEFSEEEVQGEENLGFELISLLTACIEAIQSKNISAINHFIAKLGGLASPSGNTISRLISYYTEALALRVARLWPHIFHITLPREFDRVIDEDSGTAIRILNQVSPIPKFLHFTANEMLLRAFEGKDKVHIIDFDIKQGFQWPSFFQSLASRPNPPSHVRITGIGESKQELNETGDRLSGFAEALNLDFEFHPVIDRLEDVRLWMLHVKENESVAVNCTLQLHKILHDETGGALRDFLGLIRSTNPVLVVVAEQEAEHNSQNFQTRVTSSLQYYSAVFDCIDSSFPLDSAARIKIEEMFGKEIRNIVACEGSGRVERHEKFEKWSELMEQHGGYLRCKGISEREILQGQMLVKMYSCREYGVKKNEQGQQGVGITLSWLDQTLYTVSAWEPVEVLAGEPS